MMGRRSAIKMLIRDAVHKLRARIIPRRNMDCGGKCAKWLRARHSECEIVSGDVRQIIALELVQLKLKLNHISNFAGQFTTYSTLY